MKHLRMVDVLAGGRNGKRKKCESPVDRAWSLIQPEPRSDITESHPKLGSDTPVIEVRIAHVISEGRFLFMCYYIDLLKSFIQKITFLKRQIASLSSSHAHAPIPVTLAFPGCRSHCSTFRRQSEPLQHLQMTTLSSHHSLRVRKKYFRTKYRKR